MILGVETIVHMASLSCGLVFGSCAQNFWVVCNIGII